MSDPTPDPTPEILWLAASVADAAFARAEALVAGLVHSPAQDALFAAALRGIRADAGEPFAGALHFPIFVYAGLRGTYEPAIDLAAVLVLLNLGIHILDDLGDGDLPRHWAGFRPSEIGLVATALVGVVPQLLLTHVASDAATVVRLQQTLGTGLLLVAAGQQTDLRLCDSADVTSDDVLAAVAAKAGERRAMYARLAGQLAGASAEEIAPYEVLGLALGSAAQLASDCADLFATDAEATDLMNGTRTLPIVLRLEQLHGQERAEFLERLDASRTALDVRSTVCDELRAAGIPLATAFHVEIHRQRALRALAAASPRQPGRAGLEAMIAALSLLSTTPDAGRG